MRRIPTLLAAVFLLAVVAPVEAQNFMRAVPPSLVYNDTACALVTGGGVGPLAGGLCWRTDNSTLSWWDGTAWNPMIKGTGSALVSPVVTGGVTVSGGATVTGGLTVDSITLTGLVATSLVFTNTLGALTTTVPGVVSAPPFRTLATVAGTFQLDGDLTLPVETGGIVSPGFNAVTLRIRRAGPGSCRLTVIGGASVVETQLAAAFPC
jgi:hypothetical protein